MRRVPRIAIVGGGVGGLATALALERRGVEIVVCEQSPALNEIGAGLNLSPNALMALRVLGVEDQVIALGSESDFLVIRSWKSGRIISRMRRGAFRQQFGAPNLTVHRADLLDVLRDRKSTRLNSSHSSISYAVFCLKKKKMHTFGHRYQEKKKHDRQ